jgi:D-alanyl-D-alanine carboxypeptidase (penicillin-binding protein 5/6)
MLNARRNRRFAARWMLLVWVACGVWASDAVAEVALRDRIQPLIDRYGGSVAIGIKHLPGGEGFAHRGDEPMPTASVIKFPVLVELYQQSADGRLDLQKKVTLHEEDKVPGSGVLTSHFSPGIELTVRDAARLMIALSDNTATNLIIDQIGLPATNRRMAAWGFPETRLNAKVFRRDTSIDPQRSEQFGLGSTTANEMVRMLEKLAAGQLVNAQASEQVLEHLYACEDRTKLVRSLGPQIKVAHKSGAVARSRCDAGLIDSPTGRIAICVLTTDNSDQSWSDDNAAHVFCGDVARAAFDHFNPPTPSPDQPLPELADGEHGDLVEMLQRTLNVRLEPSPELSVDGDFGPQTKDAVIHFQQQHQLAASGRMDAATWQRLGPLVQDGLEVPVPETVNSALLSRHPPDNLDGPPIVSCRAWGVLDAASGEMLWSHHDSHSLDPASTTKVMTALVTLKQAQQHTGLLDQAVVFSERADQTIGSTSGLTAGEVISLNDLLYGLLLPSGNDASVAIAEHVGQRLTSPGSGADDPVERFVALMNDTATELGLHDTTYRNPHGLGLEGHQTSVRDLAKLTRAAIELPRFRDIVATRQYGCTVGSRRGYTRNVVWKNTNELLEIEGFSGIKTGTTRAAGACLVACGSRAGRQLIVVTLGSASSPGRYVDTRNLFRWAWRQLTPADELLSSIGSARAPVARVEVSSAAREIHEGSLLIDGHNDLPWRFRELGMPSFDRVDLLQSQSELHTDIPRLLQGGVGAQFWSVYVPVKTSQEGKALLMTLEQIEFVHAMVRRYPETFRLALTHDDILACRRDQKIGCLIGVEGGHCIENSLNVLRQLYQRGARYMTLTHSATLDWADSATDRERHGGLTDFGEEVVREMNRLGMMVDLSHVSIETMKDALQVTRAPVIYSHSSARGIADHPRNVSNDVLPLVADNGGVVMVNFYPAFLVPATAQHSAQWIVKRRQLQDEGRSDDEIARQSALWQAQHPVDRGSIHDVVDHIDYLVRQAGIDHVGIGSDFDGIDMVPGQLEDVSTYPRITQELLSRGYKPPQIQQILGGNLMRVFRAVEQAAK